jgi:hypothetical protein
MDAVINTGGGLETLAVDVLLERYISWRAECRELRRAYQRWSESRRHELADAYADYVVALDREEEAAGAYARQFDWVERITSDEDLRRPRDRYLEENHGRR